jgi:acyl carrier protein
LPGHSPTADPAAAAGAPDAPGAPDDLVDEVLEVVRGMLVEIIGAEYLLDLSIDLTTSFDADLELESLEFVTLAERLLARYGAGVDFIAWLATKELDEIIGLTVGDLVAFIVPSLREA